MAIGQSPYPGGPPGGSGPAWKEVHVVEVSDTGTARCQDSMGNEVEINVASSRSRIYPKAGERWLIDQQYSGWTFAVLLGGWKRPVVTGSRAASDPLSRSILAALVDLGLVTDQSTA